MKIAQRFSAGNRDRALPSSPAKGRQRWFSAVPCGTNWSARVPKPSIEMLGYCLMSLIRDEALTPSLRSEIFGAGQDAYCRNDSDQPLELRILGQFLYQFLNLLGLAFVGEERGVVGLNQNGIA